MAVKSEVIQRRGEGARLAPVLNIARDGGGVIEYKGSTSELAQGFTLLIDTVFGAPALGLLDKIASIAQLAAGTQRMAWMRQLPSAGDISVASFRSTAEAEFTPRLHTAALLDGDYTLEITDHHSLHLAHELGLPAAGGTTRLAAGAAYYMHFDLEVGRGKDLWVET